MLKRNIAGGALIAFWLCGTLLAQPQCGPQHLVGVWSASAIGWTTPTVPGPWPTGETLPTVGVGLISIDHSAKLSGPGTVVFAGLALDYNMVGTVEVNSDCAGVVRYTVKITGFPDLAGYVERFVLDLTRHEIVTASVRSPISKPMWVMTMKRISAVPAAVTWPGLPAQN
jgi:hypothetical protein